METTNHVKIIGFNEPEKGIDFILHPKEKSLGWKAEGADGNWYGGYEDLEDTATEIVIEAFGRLYESAVRTLKEVEEKHREKHTTEE